MPTRPALLAVLLSLPVAALAAAPGDPVTAVRRQGPIVLDGRLEDAAWDLAPAYDGFVDVFPDEGATPSERTEVRVLYDDRDLYVGVVAHDRSPGEIRRPLGRRDSAPYSDIVAVVIDSMRDQRAAYYFEVNAAGVQRDLLLFGDDTVTTDWDAVWDGAAAAIPDGWSAELRIPLSALRFSDAPEQVWGFGVKRVIARRHEEILSVVIPRNARGQLARLGALVGLSDLKPVRELELQPYVAARLALQPRVSDVPAPRDADPIGDVGLDLRTSIGRGLSLQGALNPDFGQVEADQLIQNLSTFEAFFPEKRPFFTQGMDIFQPVAVANRRSPQQLFYSRRIGLDAPILGAAKVTGKATGDVQVGVVESLVLGAGSMLPDGDATRTLRLDAAQPFHVGPPSALPQLAPVPRNFLAAVARWEPTTTRSFGLTATSAQRLGPDCTLADAGKTDPADDPSGDPRTWRPARCDVDVGDAAALDWNLRTPDAAWFFLGQVTGSRFEGGAPARAPDGSATAPYRTLADGTVLRRGDVGGGAHAALGRVGGEPWRFELHWEYESPKLDVNALGYQRTQNEQMGRALVRFVRPNGGGPFHSWSTVTGVEGRITTDGRGLERGAQAWISSEFQLRTFQWFGCTAVVDAPFWDVREISETGVALERPGDAGAECYLSLDPSKPVWGDFGVGGGRSGRAGPLAPLPFYEAVASVGARPHPRVETRVEARYELNRWRARWIDEPAPGTYRFADLRAPALSVTLRQQVVLTPRLTLQAYGQLFTTAGQYRSFWTATATGGKVRAAALVPAPAPPLSDNDFREGVLNLNVVLRWEYRLGSTLYLVYTRSQAEPDWTGAGDDAPPATVLPHALGRGPATDTFLVKWSYYWHR